MEELGTERGMFSQKTVATKAGGEQSTFRGPSVQRKRSGRAGTGGGANTGGGEPPFLRAEGTVGANVFERARVRGTFCVSWR